MPRRLLLVLLPLVVALAAVPAFAASLPAGSTRILSGTASLDEPLPTPVGRARLTAEAVGGTGVAVAFSSESDGLIEGDDDRVENVYVKLRPEGEVVLVSRATGADGEPAHADCSAAALSDGGTRVAFQCEGPLDPADTNGVTDVYVRDLATARTILVSRGPGEAAVGDGASFDPTIDEDGRRVAFTSTAKNLDPTATNGGSLVFRRELDSGVVTLVSRGPSGPIHGEEPSMNADGNRIAFTSSADVVAGDANGVRDVLLRDVPANAISLVSRADGDGAAGNRASYAPSLDAGGTAVAFESQASTLDPTGDTDASPDVYRRSMGAKTTRLVSETAGGDKGQVSQAPSIDRSGTVVAFRSSGTQLHPADTDSRPDAYVKDTLSNKLLLASRGTGDAGPVANAVGLRAVAVSGGGGRVAFGLDDGLVVPDVDGVQPTVALRDVLLGLTWAVARPSGTGPFRNTGGAASAAALSADGRFAAFVTEAPGLGVPSGTPRAVVVRDRVTGQVVVASRADGTDGRVVVPDRELPAISADGRRVAWSVGAGPDRGVWVRDLPSGRTLLASRADGPAGLPGDGLSADPALDADGDRVAFTSRATNLGDGDTDATDDVHVRDLALDRTILASSSAAGAKGDGPSFAPDLDAAGTRVVFRSSATNLADGDADTIIDVHRKDLADGSLRLVSATPGGAKGDGSAVGASVDATGDRVAFATTATNLGGGTATATKVLVRDLARGELVVASRADGPDGAPADTDADSPVISPDGGSVAFSLAAPDGGRGLHVRDLATGRTSLVSRRDGTDAPVTAPVTLGDLSAGGGCVSFATADAAVGARGDGPQSYRRVLGADCGRPVAGAPGGGPDGGPGGGAGGPGGGPGGPGNGRAAPRITSVRLRPATLRIARGRATARRASLLSFRSSARGRLTLRLTHVRTARRFTVRRSVRVGMNRMRLTGLVGRRRLPAGTYRLTLTVIDAAGTPSTPTSRRLTVVRAGAR